jgi:hypothetical protein
MCVQSVPLCVDRCVQCVQSVPIYMQDYIHVHE